MLNVQPVQLLTFYSYKGGVGRTMALANVACQLANKHGKHIIAVDWDLEAPGLHYYLGYEDQDLQDKKGLLDYLEDFALAVGRGDKGREPVLDDYLLDLKPELKQKIHHGSVRLMPCGRMDEHYMSRVQALDWGRFYAEQQGFQIIETLKAQIRDSTDMGLIDARAGQADIGATTTIQVPDAVVLLFTANHQNLQGTANIARQLRHHPERKAQGFPELRMLFIPSRIFVEEDRYTQWLKDTANPVYQELIKEGTLNEVDQFQGLEQCVLAVDPRYAFAESLPVLDPDSIRSHLKGAYADLAQATLDLNEGVPLWSTMRFRQKNPEPNEAELRQLLEAATERGDEYLSSIYGFLLSQQLILNKNYIEAEVLLRSSLAYDTGRGRVGNVPLIFNNLGVIKTQTGRQREAQAYFKKAYEKAKAIRSDKIRISALLSIAIIFDNSQDFQNAETFYSAALRESQKTSTPTSIALSRLGLGQIAGKQGDTSKAREHLEAGIEIATQSDKTGVIELLRTAIAKLETNPANQNN